jgi:hypothetical protein
MTAVPPIVVGSMTHFSAYVTGESLGSAHQRFVRRGAELVCSTRGWVGQTVARSCLSYAVVMRAEGGAVHKRVY